MSPDEEIQRLESEIKRHSAEHPLQWGTLRITNTSFRACTKSRWEAHNWSITDEEVYAILNGDEEARRKAFCSLLRAHCINAIEVVPGVDIIDLVANPDVQDGV